MSSVMRHLRYRTDRLSSIGVLILLATILSYNIELSGGVPSTTNISNTSGSSTDPVIAASGPNVYVAWVDDTSGSNDILYKMSGDGGETFGDQVILDDDGGASANPRIAASGPNVYVAWTVNNEIFFVASNDGSTFGDTINLSSNPTTSSDPRIAASDSNVYIAWTDGLPGSSDIILVASNDTGDTFGNQITLDDDAGSSTEPRIAASGTNVYLAWRAAIANNEIFFTASNDSATTFSDSKNLSSNSGNSQEPRIAASGSNVYVVWRDNTPGSFDIFAAASNDGGNTFGDEPVNINSGSISSQEASVAVSETTGDVYVVWRELVDVDLETIDVFFSTSDVSGNAFSEPVNLSSNPGSSLEPSVAASSSGVHVAWRDNFIDSINNEILSTFSEDGGQTFISPINLSNSPADTFKPGLAITDTGSQIAVIVMYEIPDDSSPPEIFLQRNVDFSEAVVSISSVSNLAPRWEIDTVSVSGTLSNAVAGDTVTIDWGDGSSTAGLVFLGSNWGPADHTYESDTIASNPIEIVAHLMDSTNITKASSGAEPINVQKHSSLPELDSIAAIPPGSNVTISGTLIDVDTTLPITGALVTLNGTGVEALSLVGGLVTGPDGKFSITGPSQNSTGDDWTVQAHFAGSQEYGPSDSDLGTYATVGSDAVQFNVTSGQNSIVDLTNLSFNASMTFESVLEDGSIFVSECATPPSDRYVALDFCLQANSAVLLEEGSDIMVSVSLEGFGFGGTLIWNDIDMFHEDAFGNIVDITKSRDLDTFTVSGVSSGLSKFIVGTAVHEPEPEGALRQQMFVSSEPDNAVIFRNITSTANSTAQISLNKQSYKVGETAVLTITDPEGDVDPSEIDIVSAGIKSQTSGSEGITIVLHETTASSGIFQGTFTLISGPSSGSSLQASTGDLLTVAYNIPARAQIMIDGIIESGLLQVTDYLVSQEADFVPFGGAMKAELIDAQLSEGSRVQVTLSYANARIGGNDPNNLRLLQEVQDGVWIDITERDFQGNITGVDTDAKTITGETGTLGAFSIGGDIGTIGGAGGGVSRPGTGLVLDFVASIAASSRSGGGGGSSTVASTQTSTTVQTEEGTNVKSALELGESRIEITFEEVSSSGDIYLEEVDDTDLPPGAFSSASAAGNTMMVDGSEAQTVGRMYDISLSSNFAYEGPLYLTLPYNQTDGPTDSSEMNVRLMHFHDSEWVDTTISVNTTANTVTGKLDSLSTVVAAFIEDGTFGDAYHANHAHSKVSASNPALVDQTGNVITDGAPEQLNYGVSISLANAQRVEQPYVVVAQVLDEDGVVMSINTITGTLDRAQHTDAHLNLDILPTGDYLVQIFIFNDITAETIEMLAPPFSVGASITEGL